MSKREITIFRKEATWSLLKLLFSENTESHPLAPIHVESFVEGVTSFLFGAEGR